MEIISKVTATITRRNVPCSRCGKRLNFCLLERYWDRFDKYCGEIVCPQCLRTSNSEEERELHARSPESCLILTEESIFGEPLPDETIITYNLGFVYFLQSGQDGPIKIGYTTDIQKRIKALQTAHPFPLKLLLVINGNVDDESKLHKKFNSLRFCGEWFSPDEKLLQYIEKLKAKSVKTLNLQ